MLNLKMENDPNAQGGLIFNGFDQHHHKAFFALKVVTFDNCSNTNFSFLMLVLPLNRNKM